MSIAYRIPVDADYLQRARQVTDPSAGRAASSAAKAPWLRWITRAILAALVVFLGRLHDWTGVALVGLGLAGSFGSEILQRRSRTRARERTLQSAAELWIGIDDDGLTAANGQTRDTLPWADFQGAVEHSDGVLLALKTRGGYWLPDACLSAGTIVDSRELIARYLGAPTGR